jgi:TPR repeat protein
VEARALLAQARQAAPELAAVYEVEGVLLDGEDKREEAARALGRAAELGSTSFHIHHRLAQLLWAPNLDAPALGRIEASLEKAVAINADSADALAYLADVKAQTDSGEAALPHARRAVALEPGTARHRLTLARVLGRDGQREAAAQEAQRALAMTKVAAERKQAEELIAWLSQAPAGAVAPAKSGGGAATATGEAARCLGGDTAACADYATQLQQRCESGQAGACSALAWLVDEGRGVAKDAERAAALYAKACDAGMMEACTMAAVRQAGKGDLAGARTLLERACRGGQTQACSMLASLPSAK